MTIDNFPDGLPTDADLAFYREHGYYVSPVIFTEEELDEVSYGVERFYAGECDFPLAGKARQFSGWKPGGGEGQRTNDYVSLLIREIADFLLIPRLAAIAARLADSAVIRLWHDQLIVKPPGRPAAETGIGWHTDRAYWMTCSSENMLTAWIPLHDCDETMGTLQIIDASHRWSGGEQLRGFHHMDLAQMEERIAAPARDLHKVPLVLKKGQVSFHHCRTIHGSGPNRSARPRISLSVHLQDETNRYREHRGPDGELIWHHNDVLCRRKNNRPDYTDPAICPVLWPL